MTPTEKQTMRERLNAAIGPCTFGREVHLELVLAECLRVKA